ncbi:MAG: hypothetical protein RIQ62_1551 [Bacteroidota bacterium]
MLELFLSIGYTAFFIFLIGKMKIFRTEAIPTNTYKLLFLVKLAAGFFLYLIYTRYYPDRSTADIFRYFDDSDIMYQSLFTKPYDFFRMLTGFHAADPDLQPYYDAMRNWYNTDMIFNDTRTMIRFSALMKIFSMRLYYPHAVLMCFLSLLGLTGIYRLFISALPGRELVLMVAVYLMPSTLLWTSGLIKEAFLMFALGMLFYTIQQIIEGDRRNVLQYVKLIVFLYCLFLIKPYIIFMMIPGVTAWLMFKYFPSRRLVVLLSTYAIYAAIMIFSAEVILGQKIPNLLTSKQNEFYFVAERDHANSVIEIPRLDGSYLSMIRNAPQAFINVLFRPSILEIKNPLMLFAAAENLFLIIFILFAVLMAIKYNLQKLPDLFYIAFFFSSAIFVLTGLVTPILGAVVRYKVPAYPFFLFVVIAIIPEQVASIKLKWLTNKN